MENKNVALIPVNMPFGTIYVQSSIDEDEKVRIFDSRKEYFDYLEGITFIDIAKTDNISVETAIRNFANSLSELKTIIELLDAIPTVYVYVADNLEEALNYAKIEEYANSEEELFNNEFVNVIGKHYIFMS